VVAGISVFFICTSVISFCLKTLPGLRVEIPLTLNHTSSNLSDIYHLAAPTTEANFIVPAASQPRSFHSGLFNRYSVRAITFSSLVLLLQTQIRAIKAIKFSHQPRSLVDVHLRG
jgi:hypothetical protein